MTKKQKEFVIAVGGSLICPEKINFKFLKSFSDFIKREIQNKKKFVLVVGGGGVARKYQESASRFGNISDEDKDIIGIQATKVNAHFLRVIFQSKESREEFIFDKRFKFKNFAKSPLLIASGWKPGNSTDFVAVQIAVDFGIKRVIILGKPDYVYTADPQKSKKAKPIEAMKWSEYLKMIPSSWKPGLHSPVDPLAAKLAKKKKIEVIVTNWNLRNFKNILENKKFKGTLIY